MTQVAPFLQGLLLHSFMSVDRIETKNTLSQALYPSTQFILRHSKSSFLKYLVRRYVSVRETTLGYNVRAGALLVEIIYEKQQKHRTITCLTVTARIS